ncbi:class I SAM-dependent methyltransferase [Chryseobacterium sp.]|uniref:class I SAM-dependent methyltransferase n=1 Tax=Chryseobacterium sp. TaxID=1871047 RepID=UPI0033419E05
MYEKNYWDSYYPKHKCTLEPSSFAVFVKEYLNSNDSILEVGAGNGRDSNFFLKENYRIQPIDKSKEAVISINTLFKKDIALNMDIRKFHFHWKKQLFDCIYSRFVLHAMSDYEEEDFINYSSKLLKDKGKIFIECRSEKDDLKNKGIILSSNERLYEGNHYRRFINKEQLMKKLIHKNFNIIYSIECTGLSTNDCEDPCLIRIIAEKA